MKTQLFSAVLLCALSTHSFAFSKADVADNSGNTPLIYPIKTDKQKIASILIKKGQNLNMKDNSGLSAVHYAAKKGNQNLYKKMKTQGADLKATDAEGNNTLFHKLAGRNKRIIKNHIQANRLDLAHINKAGETAYKLSLKNGTQDAVKRINRGRN